MCGASLSRISANKQEIYQRRTLQTRMKQTLPLHENPCTSTHRALGIRHDRLCGNILPRRSRNRHAVPGPPKVQFPKNCRQLVHCNSCSYATNKVNNLLGFALSHATFMNFRHLLKRNGLPIALKL